VVVTGQYADGSQRDVTTLCEFALEGEEIASLDTGGFLTPKKDGSSILVVKAGGQKAHAVLTVKDVNRAEHVRFRHELIAALNVGGCTSGACHGTPSGKNGFKLSLRGYDPAADHLQLTRDVLARRTNRHLPEASLIYQKALGRVPHEGGQRF